MRPTVLIIRQESKKWLASLKVHEFSLKDQRHTEFFRRGNKIVLVFFGTWEPLYFAFFMTTSVLHCYRNCQRFVDYSLDWIKPFLFILYQPHWEMDPKAGQRGALS